VPSGSQSPLLSIFSARVSAFPAHTHPVAHSAADQRLNSPIPSPIPYPTTVPSYLYPPTLLPSYPRDLGQPPGPTTQDPTLCRRTIGMGVVSHSDLWSSVLRLVSTGRGSRVPLSTHRPRLTRCTVIWGHADLATHPEQEEGEGEGL
jgi:hypothetical protein